MNDKHRNDDNTCRDPLRKINTVFDLISLKYAWIKWAMENVQESVLVSVRQIFFL